MENLQEYTTENLQRLSYRILQQTAKALSLPSNVKKVHLIQLIHAKKHCSAEQVDNLVKQVRLERQQLALMRKRAKTKKKNILQSTAVSSTSNSKSPPITATPKRVTQIMIRYSPDQYLLPKKYSNRRIIRTVGQTTVSASDRVLRSSRSAKNNNFVLNNRVTTVRQEDKYQQVNMTSLLKKRSLEWRSGNEIVPVMHDIWKPTEIIPRMSPQPVRRQRRLSGIYPLHEEPHAQYRPLVSVRRSDGTLSKLNAYYIHNTSEQNDCAQQQQGESQALLNNQEPQDQQSLLSIESTDSSTTLSTISATDNYSNNVSNLSLEMSSETSLSYDNTEEINISNTSSYKENQEEYTVYYHKKIRAEQVRCSRRETARSVSDECTLPKINDVFSKFSDVYARDATQPVNIQMENNPAIASNPSLLYPELHNSQTTMLERLYNLKSVFVVNQPLRQLPTSADTRCVYSTPLVCTAKPQPTTSLCGLYNIALSQDSQQYYLNDLRDQDFSRNYRFDEGVLRAGRAISSSGESPAAQELGANVTIPEMVEDAFELISQDGDYMERMGMDIRVQCVLCQWAGPKIILEYHIRNEHGGEIMQWEGGECCATYTLGALWSRRAWLRRVLACGARLYVLSAKYDDPDCFCATLAAVSSDDDMPKTGSITTYNKVTGEPFTWKGLIPSLPLPDEHTECLKLELSTMNLLPNSANLKLLNRELVVRSPSKVVVGQPELDNIHITLIVKLFD